MSNFAALSCKVASIEAGWLSPTFIFASFAATMVRWLDEKGFGCMIRLGTRSTDKGKPMIYRVRARFKTNTAAAFLKKLTDGTVQQQTPDGPEIVASMNRAVLNEAGEIEWSERCYCNSPLAHERATVLDAHFDDMSTRAIEEYQQYEGEPFMKYLEQLAGQES